MAKAEIYLRQVGLSRFGSREVGIVEQGQCIVLTDRKLAERLLAKVAKQLDDGSEAPVFKQVTKAEAYGGKAGSRVNESLLAPEEFDGEVPSEGGASESGEPTEGPSDGETPNEDEASGATATGKTKKPTQRRSK